MTPIILGSWIPGGQLKAVLNDMSGGQQTSSLSRNVATHEKNLEEVLKPGNLLELCSRHNSSLDVNLNALLRSVFSFPTLREILWRPLLLLAAHVTIPLLQLAGRGYNILLVARGKEGLKRAAKELTEASRFVPRLKRTREKLYVSCALPSV